MNNKTPNSTKHNKKNKNRTRTYNSRNIKDVETKPIDWLWHKRIATKINIIAGTPGVGKSQLTLNMVATVTTGGMWPDGTTCKKGSAIIISSEDDIADTIKPRLQAAGAVLKKIDVLYDAVVNGEPQAWTLANIDALSDAVRDQGDTRLIVIDPITAYFDKNSDSHNNAFVRSLLTPLQELAAEHNVCILLITHLNKNKGLSAGDRITGSGAWVALSRSTWTVGFHPEDNSLRVMVPVKNNVGNDTTGFSYHIESHTTVNKIETSRIVWNESVKITASEVKTEKTKSKANSAISEEERAIQLIESNLKTGMMRSTKIQKKAKKQGISKSTFNRARKFLTDSETIRTVKIRDKWYIKLMTQDGRVNNAIHPIQTNPRISS